VRVVELQSGEVVRPARLPQEAELKVCVGCKLVPPSESEPVLVEHFFIITNVQERLVVDIDEVGTRLYGFVVQRYEDLKAITSPVGIFGLSRPIVVHSRLIEPALLKSEPMLKCCARPDLLDGELLIEPVLDDISAPVVPIQAKLKEFFVTIPQFPFQEGSTLSAGNINYNSLKAMKALKMLEEIGERFPVGQ
jgi:hypothetical protein